LTPTYTPSAADIATGSVTLTLHASGNPPCTDASSSTILTITHSPLASAGASAGLCEGSSYTVGDATASYYSGLLWTTTGNGTLTNESTLTPTYLPSSADYTIGSVTLTLTAYANSPCIGQVTSSKVLLLQYAPSADAGPDATICQPNPYTIVGASAANYLNLNWTSSGTGSFTGNGTLTPAYHPSVADYATGLVTLTLHANGIAPCNTPATASMVLHLVSSPIADAGPDAAICGGGSYTVSGASVANQSSFLWTTSGTGSLTNPATLTPTYTPSAADISAGSVTLTLTAYATAPCASNATDQMIITIQSQPTSNAGSDATICEGGSHTLSGSATHYASFNWTTNGTGTFANGNTFTPTYTPSSSDIAAGSVIITLTAVAITPCGVNASDQMTLTLISKPITNAGPDASICSTGGYLLSQATASHYSSILWSTSGDGTFTNSGALNPTYNPGPADITLGHATLTLTAQPLSPCTSPVSDFMVLNIIGIPTANAGPDISICEGSYTLTGASATNYSTLQWTSSGSGTLTNATTLTPTYTPSPADILSGSVTLTLTASGILPCTSQAADAITLTIIPKATANAGSDASICGLNNYTVNNATASNFISLVWTHNGNGTLSNATTLSPTYSPSPLDLISGSVTLTLSATSNAPCTSVATDQMVIQLVPNPLPYAGPNTSICGGNFTVNGATCSNYASLYWTSSGTGSFTNSTTLNPTYTPSAADNTAGSVILSLHALALAPCIGEVVAGMTLTILPAATVQAGGNAIICSGDNYPISGSSATNYASVNWTSSGSGSFSNSALLHPTYFPSASDRANGSVVLTLSATGLPPCNGVVTDAMVLTIAPVATANAGPDINLCEGSILDITAATAGNYSTLSWSSSGTGTFSNTTWLNPSYTPSSADIAAGSVILTLSATGVVPCTAVATDAMVLTITHPAQANAGPDALVCAGNPFYIPTASAGNYTTIYWTTSGTGTFLNGTTLTPTYDPSVADITAGSVILTLHAVSPAPCTGEVTDGLVLTILPAATSYAGGNATICAGNNYTLSGAQATHYSSVHWTTSGSGTFTNSSLLNPTYFPSFSDITAGSVTLTLNVTGISPCGSTVSDAMVLSITSSPTANAGPDATACSLTYTITGASASNYSLISWTSTGTGTFSGGNTLSPTYTPSAADRNAGSVTLWLNANSIAPCTGTVSDQMLLTLPALPTANAGNDADICQGSSYQISGATAANYSSFQWTSSGSGSFANAGTLTPTYTPSVADIASGLVTLTLTVQGFSPCNSVAVDAMALTITKLAVCDAGPSATICAGSNYTISGASASNYSALLWQTSGTGTFQNFNTLNPTYIPSTSDIALGSVNLNLTAYNMAPCTGNTSDVMILTINQNVAVDAGPDEGVCYPAPFTVTAATASNYLNISWSTTGTGTFINTTTLHPTYFPSASDLGSGSVVLTITGQGISPCSASASDIMILGIDSPPGPAGTITGTATVCQGQNGVTYSIPVVTSASGYVWSVPSGASIVSGSNTNSITVNFGPSAVSGNITVYPVNACGSGTISSPFFVQVNGVPGAPGSISGLQVICQGTNGVVYSITPISGATGYNWTVPVGSTIVSGSNTASIIVDYGLTAVSGNVTVTGVNSCGGSTTSTLAIVVHPMPPTPAIAAGGPVTFCEGGSVTLTASPSGYNYLWSPGGQITQSIVVTSSGSYSVVLSDAFGCGSFASNVINVTVYLKITPVITAGGPTTFCAGGNVVLSAPAGAGYTYLWSNGATAKDITVSTAGSYNVVITDANGCVSYPSNTILVIINPLPPAPVVTAGGPITFCAGGSVTLSTPVVGGYTYLWSDGETTPSIIVTAQGAYSVVVTDSHNCTSLSSNIITVTVNQLPPTPSITPTGPINLCQGGSVDLTSSPAPSGGGYLWSTTETTQTITVNTAGSFTVTVSDASGCQSLPSAAVVTTIQPLPASNAGPDATACSSVYTITGASAANYSLISWSGSGTGTFTNGNTLSPAFTPSVADMNAGSVTLVMTVTGILPCTGTAVDAMVLSLPPLLTASAGSDASTCENVPYLVTGATATNYLNLQWTSSGTGTFTNATSINPTYTPSAIDIAQGSVTLTLTANGLPPCSSTITDNMVLTIVKTSVANAGPDAAICSGADFLVSGASAGNFANILWMTTGTGTFLNVNTIHPTYIPSAADIAAGSVDLTMIAYNIAPCTGNTSDVMVLTINQNVTVNAGPDASVCYPSAFTVSGASAGNYLNLAWTTSGTGTFINNGTLSPTYFPSITDLGAGSAVLTLTGTGIPPCTGPAVDMMTLHVDGAPGNAGTITGTTPVCQGQNGIVYSVPDIANATNYVWTLPSGATIVSGNNTNIITVDFGATAVSGDITVFATNSCGSGGISAPFHVTVTPLAGAAGNIAGTSIVCQGQNGVSYSVAAIPNASGYNWTLPAGAVIASGVNTNNITVNFTTSAVSGNITVQGTNSCGSGTVSPPYAVTVNPLPSPAGTISGPSIVCQGQSGAVYSVPAITGATAYAWSLPTGAGIVSGANTNVITVNFSALAASGTITVTGTNACGNGLPSIAFAVTVNPLPSAAGSITGSSSVCAGQSAVIYTVPAIGNVTGYSWSLPSGATIATGANTNSITVDFSASATSGVIIVEGTNACGAGQASAPFAVTVNTLPLAAGSITGPASVCQGQAGVSYSIAAIPNATGYNWSLPSGATIASGANTNSIMVDFSATASSGTITVLGTNTCGTGSSSSPFAVTVSPLPSAAGTISGLALVCQGQTNVLYSVTPVLNATSYLWTVPSGASIISGQGTQSIIVSYSSAAASGLITVNGNNICGDGQSSSLPVTVEILPLPAGSIVGLSAVCQGQAGVIYTVPVIGNASGYNWTLPAGASIVAGANTNSIIVNFSVSAVSGSITVQGTNTCGSGPASAPFAVTVNTLPFAAGTITGLASVCQGQTGVSYSIAAIPNATGYNWTLPSGATIATGANTNSITVDFSATASSGIITVVGTNACGTGLTSAPFTVTVNLLPSDAGTITGLATVCQGQANVLYLVTPVLNATSYVWTVPSGASIISGQGTQSIIVSYSSAATSGLITVNGNNICGDGQSSSLPVTVEILPLPAGSIVGLSAVCQGQAGVMYTVPVIGNASGYNWTLPAGATIVSGANTNSITVDFSASASSGPITVQGTNICGPGPASAPFTVTVNTLPFAAGTITGLASVCQGQTGVSYSIPAIPNATGYNWTLPPGASIATGTNTNSITVDFSASASSGTITVQGTNACGTGLTSAPFTVTVNSLPSAAGTITGLATVCQGQINVMYLVAAVLNATSYVWTVPTGAVIISGQGTQSIIVSYSLAATSGLVTVNGNNLCGDGQSSSLPVTVEILPSQAGSIVGSSLVCQGQTGLTYMVPVISNAIGYDWTLPVGASIVAGANTNVITVDFSASASGGAITVQGTNTCGSGPASAPFTVTVNTLPFPAGTITGLASVCQGQTGVSYTIAVIPNASGYNWSLPIGATIASGANTNSITVDFSATATSGTITVQGTNACGTGTPSASFAVTVNILPSGAGLISGQSVVCEGETGVVYSVSPILNATSYTWTLPVGATIVAGANSNVITVDFAIGSIDGNITVAGTNLCGNGLSSTPFPVTVNLLPTPAGQITGTPVVCQGQSGLSYSVQTIAGATGYNWTLPAGASILAGSNTSSILVAYSSGASSGFITVQGTNSCGSGTVSNPYLVTVDISPDAEFQFSNNLCVGQSVQFIDQSLQKGGGAINSWQWSFGDPASGSGNTSTLPSPVHIFVSSGAHTVALTITNVNNCSSTITHVVQSYALPLADFTATPSCSGSPTQFTDQSVANANAIASWDWDFGDGSTHSALQNPSHTYPGAGIFNATLIIINSNGCTDTVVKSVQVSSLPNAAFISSVQNCVGAPVDFTDQSSTSFGYILTWTWDFGDGTTPVTINYPGPANILHSYTLLGTYIVKLTVLTSENCSSSVTHTVTVTSGPIADYTYGTTLCVGLPVQFTDQSQTNGAGPISLWQWNFGDPGSGASNTSSQPNPSHSFTTAGFHTVLLTVTNINSCTNTTSKVIEIFSLPVANFTADSACLGSVTTFTDNSTPTGTIISWNWDFGDGSTHSSLQNPTHTYGSSGTFQVSLTVTNSHGCTHSLTKPIQVVIPPLADFSSNAPNCFGSPVYYTDLSTNQFGIITTYIWDFGDGTTQTILFPNSPDVSHIFTGTSLQHVVRLTVITDHGCTSFKEHTVISNPKPLANFSYPSLLCKGQDIAFTDLSQATGGVNIVAWSRNFGDPTSGSSNTSALQNPTHSFTAAGPFSVRLIITNDLNCKDTVIQTVTINDSPVTNFSNDNACEGAATTFTDLSLPNAPSIVSWEWDFGDGNQIILYSPAPPTVTHPYSYAGSYQVVLTVINSNGCSQSVTKTVVVYPPPVAEFTASTQNCSNTPVEFTDESHALHGFIVRRTWLFGDGHDTIITNPSSNLVPHSYSSGGVYSVSLTVKTSDSCQKTIVHTIVIGSSPIADFGHSAVQCEGSPVQFNDQSQTNGGAIIDQWLWNFGDPLSGTANLSSLQNPVHSFTSSGNFNVQLIVINAVSCRDTVIKPIVIGQKPVANFHADTACFGSATSFTDQSTSTGTITTWDWDFGDGSPHVHTQNAQHLYLTSGTLNASLTVTNISGCTNSVSKQVKVNALPVAAFSYAAVNCAGAPVTYNDLSFTPQGYIVTWHWTFGDGHDTIIHFPGNQNVSHIYLNGGSYNVVLAIKTSDSCANSVTHQVSVGASPVANFTFAATRCQSSPVSFQDLSQLNGGGPIISWYWNFGDPGSGVNNYSALPNPSHIYSAGGTYQVVLSVTNINNCNDTVSKSVDINKKPSAHYKADTVCRGELTHFTDQSVAHSGTLISWNWDFGDGTTSAMQNPTHTYSSEGVYNVSLVVQNSYNCQSDTTGQVLVKTPPVALFNYDNACSGSATQFHDLSSTQFGAINRWHWDFGDGDTSNLQNPSHVYTNFGIYIVVLTVTNTQNCSADFSMSVSVFVRPSASFTYFSKHCPKGKVAFFDHSTTTGAPIVSWLWTFEPGANSSSQDPTYIFPVTDTTYLVRLVITDSNGCMDTINQSVNVVPSLDFTFTSDSVCFGKITQFHAVNLAQGDTLHDLHWNFGDPNSGVNNQSTSYNPTHLFTSPGIYTVTLNAYNSDNCRDSIYNPVIVFQHPVSHFSFDTIPYCDSTVTFHNLSVGNAAAIDSLIWIFGDGDTTIQTKPVPLTVIHKYLDYGSFTVQLKTINSNGCSDVSSKTVLVSCLTALITEIDTLKCEREKVMFNDSSGPVSLIKRWYWNFGDGLDTNYTKFTRTIRHQFDTVGTYTVTLVVSMTNNNITITDTNRLTIHVKSTPIAAFTAPAVCLGDSTKFINLSDSNGYSIVRNYWKFGDSGPGITDTSNLVNPAYKYPRYGKYHSMLVVQNSLGCRDTLKRDVKVYKLPQALFLSPVSCSRQEVFFTDKSKAGDTIITNWNWAFGDPVNNQDSSTQRNPSHKYHQAGKYFTSLMVKDYYGCKDTLRDSVNVLQSPLSAFTYRDNVDGISGKLQFTNKSQNAITYNWDFGNGKTSVEENPEVAYDQDGSYVITLAVTSTNSCEDSTSLKYEFIFHGLYVPNLFAPTDMVYQVRFFKPAGINLASYNIAVYDIAGHKLWESSALDDFGRPLEGWDGTVNGNLMPQGTYTWKISAMFKDGKVWEGSNTGKGSTSTMGTVTLVR